jgi:hypothetical protein
VKRVRLIGDHHAVHHHGAELTVAHDAVVGGGAVLVRISLMFPTFACSGAAATAPARCLGYSQLAVPPRGITATVSPKIV